MIKLLCKIEKTKAFWALLAISFLFFLLRLPSLIEPNWYGDEGYYQVIGMALNNGSLLYSQIWDNKPPLLYIIYAFFHGDQFSVRLASLFVGLFTTWAFYYLSKKFFNHEKTSLITTSIFALLFATPLIEGNIANAENFMLLPIILSAILIFKTTNTKYKIQNTKYLISAGLLLGIAFILKIVAIFDFAAFLTFLLINTIPEKEKLTIQNIKNAFIFIFTRLKLFIIGFFAPFLITIIYFGFNNALSDFMGATFFGNIGYVGYGNKLLFPQGFLIIKLIILTIFITTLIFKRNKISKATLFVLVWLGFSIFNALFSQRPYTHYVLVLLPSVCLMIGSIINENKPIIKRNLSLFFLITIFIVLSNFNLYSLKKTINYYPNALAFVTGQKNVTDYQAFFDSKTPRDYEIAAFIRNNTKPNDKIFIWGDSPQIYALSKTLPISKFPVSYQTLQNKNGVIITQNALNILKPKYVIILYEAQNFPFQLDSYSNRFSLDKATIYEKAL